MKTKVCKICGNKIYVSGWKLEPANKTPSSILRQPTYFDNLNCLRRWVELFIRQNIEIDKLISLEPLKNKE